jgi:hypothetical protein
MSYWEDHENKAAHWSGGKLAKIKEAIFDFDAVLKQGSEQAVQTYLENWPFIFEFLCDDGAGFIQSHPKLAEKLIPDFVIFSRYRWTNNPFLLCTFIEIENPSMPLFTRAGNPTSQLTHAIRQVQDWKSWVRNNSQYLQKELAFKLNNEELLNVQAHRMMKPALLAGAVTVGVSYRYMVIAGRRTSLQISDLVRLTEMNENMNDIKVVTYDAILSGWINKTHNTESIFTSWNIIE